MALALIMIFTVAGPAQADYYSGGMPGTKFNVRYVSISSTWTKYFDEARARWNRTTRTGVSIGKNSEAAATMTAARYSETWFGLYSPSGIRGINRAFQIKVNSRTLVNSGGANASKWIASTSTHELGHALSLHDNPSTPKSSLMKHNRNRTIVIQPQSYDISEVKRIY